jgi:Tfp pilus assembly protein PilF
MLGELLLELRQPRAALAAFEQSLQADPNRFRNLYGAARSAEQAGDRVKARGFYAQLVDQVGPRAAERAEIREARAFLVQ